MKILRRLVGSASEDGRLAWMSMTKISVENWVKGVSRVSSVVVPGQSQISRGMTVLDKFRAFSNTHAANKRASYRLVVVLGHTGGSLEVERLLRGEVVEDIFVDRSLPCSVEKVSECLLHSWRSDCYLRIPNNSIFVLRGLLVCPFTPFVCDSTVLELLPYPLREVILRKG